ncbi:MAG: acyl-CoA dehydrogenase family protein, partial [Myxococcota bacterium]
MIPAPPPYPADFGFTDDHALLRSTARRVLGERCPMAEVRRLGDDPVGFDPALHRELAELGWTGLLVPDSLGGSQLGYLAAALVIEESGRALLPGPLWSTLLATVA